LGKRRKRGGGQKRRVRKGGEEWSVSIKAVMNSRRKKGSELKEREHLKGSPSLAKTKKVKELERSSRKGFLKGKLTIRKSLNRHIREENKGGREKTQK